MDADRTRSTTTPGGTEGHASGRSGAAPAGLPTVARPQGGSGHPRVPLGDDCWFLSGPTASGKSSLAIPLARRLGAEIVSVDSMAVYRGLDVGTAKPTPEQREAVPHHLLDVVEAGEAYSVARWLTDAAAHRAVVDRLDEVAARVARPGSAAQAAAAVLAIATGGDPATAVRGVDGPSIRQAGIRAA